ncbi:galactokinase [Evansella vedderi]|uniref:Galactokinase n=1 Tax=Evansella vedderi TaxID=38282 RepID=A0ABT9ZXW7_9BACI|nr:galactokinase [Evansella vedderi]MDQ0256086.1 galactokinase [Evansella vedderi]
MKEKLSKMFNKVYDTINEEQELHYFFAPGRVNLIGEHTDYNGGLVFPCALTVGTYAAIKQRKDNLVRLYSDNFPEKGIITVSLTDLDYKKEDDWANYPKGVIETLKKHGFEGKGGFDAVYYGNIPNGAGLSSSASIELVTAVLWDWMNDFNLDRIQLVKFSQEAENKYIGVNCGIMDQFAIGMGKEENAVLLDCNTLHYEYAPVQLEGMKLVIANTNKRRGLADSKYNERRSECENALKDLQAVTEINNLCDLSTEEFERIKDEIKDPIAQKRAAHAISENERTKIAAQKLKEKDVIAFGKLMNESHVSLRDDYEVTGEYLDALVNAAWEEENVLGSRMTGAGFGGCTVSLVREDNMEEVLDRIASSYEKATGIKPDFYIVGIGHGAKKLN